MTFEIVKSEFQYRKRYEVTCDRAEGGLMDRVLEAFQYRKRYEVTCDTVESRGKRRWRKSFNTASGMRSHVTGPLEPPGAPPDGFQYRKRYEVTCDLSGSLRLRHTTRCFNTASGMRSHVTRNLYLF